MSAVAEENAIGARGHKFVGKYRGERGITIIELVAVLGVTSVLTGIFLPVLANARRQARALQCMGNQRQIAATLNCYAFDNDDRYPVSVATVRHPIHYTYHWAEPMQITAYRECFPGEHRSMAEYLRSYISDASVMFCPNAPRKYAYLQESWDAGDDWINPEMLSTPSNKPKDMVSGTYCFYWNYIGNLGPSRGIFKGPWSPSGGRRRSKLLVSDYFGFGHRRNNDAYGDFRAYGGCEKFAGAGITEGSPASSAFWSRLESDGISLDTIEIRLHAGYADGHVECYRASQVVPMRVSTTSDGSSTYLSGDGPGDIYIPRNGLPRIR